MSLWLWPVSDEAAYQPPRPAGWAEELQGLFVYVRSSVWPATWWKLTEVYLLQCYWHLYFNEPGKLLDDTLDGVDAHSKWEMALDALLAAGVARSVDGYPTRSIQVGGRTGPEFWDSAARQLGAGRKDMERLLARLRSNRSHQDRNGGDGRKRKSDNPNSPKVRSNQVASRKTRTR